MKQTHLLIWCLYMVPGLLHAEAELPDPTRPADYITIPTDIEVVEVEDLPKQLIDWSVTSIRISSEDRSAIVNGRLVRIGDEIGPAKIIEIKPILVVLDYDDRHVVVRLFRNNVQKIYKN